MLLAEVEAYCSKVYACRPWTVDPIWGPNILQFRGSIDLPDALVRHFVIFSHILGHTVMAAEAHDHHRGDFGRLEEARTGLNLESSEKTS